MGINEIMALVNAGFTKEEIMTLAKEPTPAPAPTPEQDPAPEPAPTPVPAPTPAQEPSLAQVMESIAKLTSAVQANAIAGSFIPGGPNANQPTASDALAEIIRPTFKGRE